MKEATEAGEAGGGEMELRRAGGQSIGSIGAGEGAS